MNDKITTQFCDKTMSGDFNTEVSLPDYEPEIRRLLKVGARLAPPSGFYDGSRAGVSGRIIYDILYAGGDGELYSTLDRFGMEFNASTYSEMVQFYITGATENFDLASEIIARILSPIILSASEIKTERS